MAHFPLRNLHHRLNVSKSSAQRLRRNDPDWRELVTEFDVAGVTMADEDDIERCLARKRERGEAAEAAAARAAQAWPSAQGAGCPSPPPPERWAQAGGVLRARSMSDKTAAEPFNFDSSSHSPEPEIFAKE